MYSNRFDFSFFSSLKFSCNYLITSSLIFVFACIAQTSFFRCSMLIEYIPIMSLQI